MSIHRFADNPIFRGLTEDELEALVSFCQAVNVNAGTLLFRQGAMADAMLIIDEGQVQVYLEDAGKREVVTTLEPPFVVGELALIDQGPRSASAQALTTLKGYVLDAATFQRMSEQSPRVASKLLCALSVVVCERVRDANRRVEQYLRDYDGTLDDSMVDFASWDRNAQSTAMKALRTLHGVDDER